MGTGQIRTRLTAASYRALASGTPLVLMYMYSPGGGPPQPVCLCHAGKAQKVVQCKPGRSEFAEYFTPDSKPNRRRKRMLLNMGRRKMPAEVVAGAGNAW